ncbi:MAG: PQQ-binding-like beta-propeller repeat protein [Planctomycetota bacterium]
MMPALVFAALCALSTPAALSADWPQFMGPSGDQSAPWPGGTFTWPSGGPTVTWRASVGDGFGGAAIFDGEVFLLDRDGDKRDVLRVLGLDDGKERWQAGYDAPGRLDFKGSRTVPTVIGRHVYTTGGFGHVSCFDRDTQALVWQVDLARDFGGALPMFGWSTQPCVVGDLLVAAPWSATCSLVGLELETGKARWRTGFLGYSHATPALLTLLGREQLVVNTCPEPASGQDKAMPAWIVSVDPATGAQLWRHETVLCRLPITSPVRVDDQRLFVTGGYRAGSKLLRLAQEEGEPTQISEAFAVSRGAQVHSPVLHDGHLYMLANENWTDNRRRRAEGGLMCLGLDGKERWRTGEAPYFGRGGCVRIGDVLLVQDGFDGALRAVRLNPLEYVELGVFRPFGEVARDGQMWAPPALSGTRLVMRSQSELVCVELAQKIG